MGSHDNATASALVHFVFFPGGLFRVVWLHRLTLLLLLDRLCVRWLHVLHLHRLCLPPLFLQLLFFPFPVTLLLRVVKLVLL